MKSQNHEAHDKLEVIDVQDGFSDCNWLKCFKNLRDLELSELSYTNINMEIVDL